MIDVRHQLDREARIISQDFVRENMPEGFYAGAQAEWPFEEDGPVIVVLVASVDITGRARIVVRSMLDVPGALIAGRDAIMKKTMPRILPCIL